jgi:hypothetical protein
MVELLVTEVLIVCGGSGVQIAPLQLIGQVGGGWYTDLTGDPTFPPVKLTSAIGGGFYAGVDGTPIGPPTK